MTESLVGVVPTDVGELVTSPNVDLMRKYAPVLVLEARTYIEKVTVPEAGAVNKLPREPTSAFVLVAPVSAVARAALPDEDQLTLCIDSATADVPVLPPYVAQ